MPLVDHYELSPGCCSFCRADQRHMDRGRKEHVWDTGKQIVAGEMDDFPDGRIYVCESCVSEWGEAMGMLTQSHATELLDAMRMTNERVEYLQDRLLIVSDALEALQKMNVGADA